MSEAIIVIRFPEGSQVFQELKKEAEEGKFPGITYRNCLKFKRARSFTLVLSGTYESIKYLQKGDPRCSEGEISPMHVSMASWFGVKSSGKEEK